MTVSPEEQFRWPEWRQRELLREHNPFAIQWQRGQAEELQSNEK